jgi:hypothetical protein
MNRNTKKIYASCDKLIDLARGITSYAKSMKNENEEELATYGASDVNQLHQLYRHFNGILDDLTDAVNSLEDDYN